MGFQFVHFEGYARSGGASGRSVDFVLAEAERRPDASAHVVTPTFPDIVFGMSVAEVRMAHDEAVAHARDVMTNGKSRAVRVTQKTLATVVASHPATIAEVRANPATAASVADWEQRTVAWLREVYGDALVSVIRHTDEAHAHLHAYILPGGLKMKVTDMHPGHVAKAAVMSAGPLDGEDAKAMNRRGDKAYRAAMRKWQDAYFERVGAPCGLSRLGPGRRRLTREEWRSEKHQADALRVVLQRAEALKVSGSRFISGKRDEAAVIIAEAARVKADADTRMQAAIVAQDKAVQAEKRAKGVIKRAQQELKRLKGLGGAARALWDGLRVSRIRSSVEDAVRPQIEAWRVHAAEADERAKAADQRRRQTEEELKNMRRSVSELGAQRDELRERVAVYEAARPMPSFAPTSFSPHP